jgi:hypothetical protein
MEPSPAASKRVAAAVPQPVEKFRQANFKMASVKEDRGRKKYEDI